MIDVTLQELASALITVFEGTGPRNPQGLYLPYKDSGGIWTIGKGHTKGVTSSTPPATQAQVDAWFAEDQALLFDLVKTFPLLEAAALVSFGFNCGVGSLTNVLRGHATVEQFTYDAKGKELPGLVSRRWLESLLMALSQQIQANRFPKNST